MLIIAMNTAKGSITEFIDGYAESHMTRLHMPGHKGRAVLGIGDGLNAMFERDITEIEGADALYSADGIIRESEKRMAAVYDTAGTYYSAGGSSQCIKAMCCLAVRDIDSPIIVAGRNAHISFIHAAGLLGFGISWLEGGESLCECNVTPEILSAHLNRLKEEGKAERVAAIMVTSPDYLGNMLDIRGLAEVAHDFGCLLLTDNAHGAYLAMLKGNRHPINLGADMTADSAHKTLPVLTGGSMLHISKTAPGYLPEDVKQAMLLFGSTSPSYLIMESMDRILPYLEEQKACLAETGDNDYEACARKVKRFTEELTGSGWTVTGDECLKLTVKVPGRGEKLSQELRSRGIECEFADRDFLVMMWSPANPEEDYEKVSRAFAELKDEFTDSAEVSGPGIGYKLPEVKYSCREVIFSGYETVDTDMSCGRIAAEAAAKCPPAILPVVPGEVIDEDIIKILKYYGIKKIKVIKRP